MDQHASDTPKPPGDAAPPDSSPDDNGDVVSDVDADDLGQTDGPNATGADTGGNDAAGNDEAIVATLVESDSAHKDDEDVRVGSPFAVDPFAPQPNKTIEPFYDVGPLRYTAMGAVAASVMVLAFAGTAAMWFPAGGALIAALGCALSIFGMYSHFRLTSSGLLALHLCLFVLSYARSLG